MKFDKSTASPRLTSFESTLEISRRRDMTSRVSRLAILHIIGFGPFVAFRASTLWAMSISLIEMFQAIAPKRRAQSFVVSIVGFLDPVSNLVHTDQFNIAAVTVLDQIINCTSHFVNSSPKKV